MPYFSIESPQVLTEFPKHDWETSEDYPTAYELKAVWLCGGRGSKNPKDRGNRRGQWLTHFILETPLKISYLLTSCYHSLSPRVWLTRVLSLEGICHGQGAPHPKLMELMIRFFKLRTFPELMFIVINHSPTPYAEIITLSLPLAVTDASVC